MIRLWYSRNTRFRVSAFLSVGRKKICVSLVTICVIRNRAYWIFFSVFLLLSSVYMRNETKKHFVLCFILTVEREFSIYMTNSSNYLRLRRPRASAFRNAAQLCVFVPQLFFPALFSVLPLLFYATATASPQKCLFIIFFSFLFKMYRKIHFSSSEYNNLRSENSQQNLIYILYFLSKIYRKNNFSYFFFYWIE